MRPRLISVTGTSEVSVAPDEAILTFSIETRDKDLAAAKSEHDSRFKKVMALTQEDGIEPKYIQTSNLTMEPEYSEEKITKFLGYVLSQTIQITLKDVSKYEDLMTRLLQAGVNRVNGIEFRVSEPRKFKDEARSKAIQAAREKATSMAAGLGQTIGKPWDISEAEEVYVVNSTFGADRSRYAAAPSESTIAPGQIKISASVKVSFLLE